MAYEEEIYLGMCRRWRELPKPVIAQVHVVPRSDLEIFTLDLATRIAARPSFALKLAKHSVNQALDARASARRSTLRSQCTPSPTRTTESSSASP